MANEKKQNAREKMLRNYFDKPKEFSKPLKKDYSLGKAWLGIAGIAVLLALPLFAVEYSGRLHIWLLIAAIIFFIIGLAILPSDNKRYQDALKDYEKKKLEEISNRLTDQEADEWLGKSLNNLSQQSLKKLSLDQSETISDALVVRGPILWTTNGINDKDLVWKRGDDNKVRFGVYRLTIIQLTNRHLGAYGCDYNFIKDVALNERTDEYYYKDIVSVSTQEEASSYTLPTGIKLTTAQNFKLSVANGEAIRVTIGAAKIGEVVGTDDIPETGAEKAISVIRAMLREKKG